MTNVGSAWRLPLFFFVAGVVLYGACAASTPLWGDSARLSLFVLDRDYGPALVSPGHHSLTIRLAVLISSLAGLAPHLALSLLSVVCAALTLAVFASLLRRLGFSLRKILLATVGLGLSHTFLFIATVQESYAPALLLFVLLLRAGHALWQTPRPTTALWAGLLIGLSLLNHPLPALVFMLGFVPFLVARHRAVRVALCVACALGGALVGLAPQLIPILVREGGAVGSLGVDWDRFVPYLRPAELPRALAVSLAWILWQIPAHWMLLLANLRNLRRPSFEGWQAHLAMLVVATLLASMYLTQRRFLMLTLIVPGVLMFLCAALPERSEAQGRRRVYFVSCAAGAANMVVFAVTAWLAAGPAASLLPELRANRWRSAGYYVWPLSHLRESPRALADTLARAYGPPLSTPVLLVGDFTFLRPLQYAQRTRGWLPNVKLEEIDRSLRSPAAEREKLARRIVCRAQREGRRIVLVSYPDRYLEKARIGAQGVVVVEGELHRLIPSEALPCDPR